ncbi:hypothetical protein M2323_003920 [Rhodoblastus acidophilus]|uniref:hypothetical protein n=1 Tax=Rhodoblastus acidophilus TaxID=1074 RepID=UPI0022251077|nr:hypothetical protein [Rhodoblastus acidophilus]MCW2286083.1 hypothetical protein [Rhodoblastus acidophilus]MCW2334977.1 hypothetical protein [Rhodoblastus acidophilus]
MIRLEDRRAGLGASSRLTKAHAESGAYSGANRAKAFKTPLFPVICGVVLVELRGASAAVHGTLGAIKVGVADDIGNVTAELFGHQGPHAVREIERDGQSKLIEQAPHFATRDRMSARGQITGWLR